MVNALANAFAAALQESGDTDPLQRLRALVAKFGIKGRPSRKTCRLVVALARRLGVEFPESEEPRQKNQLEFPVPSLERERPGNGEAESHRPVGRWRMPPAAESVIRRREKEWRELLRERYEKTVFRLRRSPVGRKVALMAKDLSAGARAIQVLGALGVDSNQIDTEALAWAGRLTPEDVKYLFRKDAALLPEAATVAGTFGDERRRTAVILKSRVKRPALDGGAPTPLTAPVEGVEVDEATAQELLGDYTEAVAQRAAVKRGLLALYWQRAQGVFPQEPPANRWARLAWLTFVGHARPPVIPALWFQARKELKKELTGTALTEGLLRASLNVARRTVHETPVRKSA